MNNKIINDMPVTKIIISPMLYYFCFSTILFSVIIGAIKLFQNGTYTNRCFILFSFMCLSLLGLTLTHHYMANNYIVDVRDEIDCKQKKLEEEKDIVKKEKIRDYSIGLKTMKEKLKNDYETKIGSRDKKIIMQQTQINKDKEIIENKDEEINRIKNDFEEKIKLLTDQYNQEKKKKDNLEIEKDDKIQKIKKRIEELEQHNEELKNEVYSLNDELVDKYGDWKKITDTKYKAWDEEKMKPIIFELPIDYEPGDVVKIEKGFEIDSKGNKIPLELADLIRDEKKRIQPTIDLRDVTPATRTVYDSIKKGNMYGFSEITRNTGLSKPAISSALKVLIAKSMVEHDEENKIYMRIT